MVLRITKLAAAATLGLLLTATSARANSINFSGNWVNQFATFGFTVTTAGTIDILFNAGYGDATLSLFDGSGNHLVTNDDVTATLNPRITQNLAVGNYFVLSSYCCASYTYALTLSGAPALSDGFNTGTFLFGGTGTLVGMEAFVASQASGITGAYDINVSTTNGVVSSAVPEPGTLLLLSTGVVALAVRRRRNARR